jgi:hypothetical protein
VNFLLKGSKKKQETAMDGVPTLLAGSATHTSRAAGEPAENRCHSNEINDQQTFSASEPTTGCVPLN